MFVSDLKENYFQYNLSEEFVDCLPDVCPSCGAPTEISPVLTGLHCSNPRCPDKIAMRINAICTELGILGFGDSRIADFMNYYDIHNPLQIFELERGIPISNTMSIEVSDEITGQIEQHKKFQLWEYVKIANIPGVQTCAKDIFSGYSTLQQAYNDIQVGGVDFIQKRMGISADNSLSVRAMQVYKNLLEYKDDLFECINCIEIIDLSNKVELNIYCSDQAGGGFKHKKDFYNKINELFGDRVVFNIAPINKKLNYLIWGGADGTPCRYTSKVDKVKDYQEKGYNIPIMTANQFIQEMHELYD